MTFMDTEAFAERLGVVAETVREWVRRGELDPAGYTPGGHLRFSEAQVALALRGRASERATAMEANVVSARAKLRQRRGQRASANRRAKPSSKGR